MNIILSQCYKLLNKFLFIFFFNCEKWILNYHKREEYSNWKMLRTSDKIIAVDWIEEFKVWEFTIWVKKVSLILIGIKNGRSMNFAWGWY